jgi:hypothetical protein
MGLSLDAEAGIAQFEALDALAELADAPEQARGRAEYHSANSLFGPMDAAVLYALIRRHRPRRIVEIGCGMSTLAALRAEARNAAEAPDDACDHVCIEPFEQPWLEGLPVRVLRQRVEDCDPALVEALEPGDILFIDSSHMIRPQGDVLTEMLDWVGRTRPGVLIHIHDIFTPRDYPEELIREHRFFWNEQYLVEAFLAFNDHFEVILPLNHLFHRHPDRVRARVPAQFAPGRVVPGSFWLRRVR